MLSNKLRSFIFSILSLCTANASADQLIIEPEMGRAPILQMINKTKHSLDLVMYGFTDETLREALLNQQRAGKSVAVILEGSPYRAADENVKTIQVFKRNHLNWQGVIEPFKLIHQKTLIIDDQQAMIMTFNFTKSTFKNERNFALIVDDPHLVKEISAVFSADWNHKTIAPEVDELIWSPNNSREKLIQLIKSAHQSIAVYSQNINDYKLVGALAKAAHQGISVNILTSATIRPKQADYLINAGVNIKKSEKLYIHAKAFIIDHKIAALGSINLTHQSMDDNRELSVLTKNPDIVKQLDKTFNNDWENADTSTPKMKTHTHKANYHHAMKLLKFMTKSLGY